MDHKRDGERENRQSTPAERGFPKIVKEEQRSDEALGEKKFKRSLLGRIPAPEKKACTIIGKYRQLRGLGGEDNVADWD